MGFALILFILILDVVLQTMDQVLSKGLAPLAACQLLLFNLAWIVALAAPMAVLIAVLMAFARLARARRGGSVGSGEGSGSCRSC